jgi:hypothetical protein
LFEPAFLSIAASEILMPLLGGLVRAHRPSGPGYGFKTDQPRVYGEYEAADEW